MQHLLEYFYELRLCKFCICFIPASCQFLYFGKGILILASNIQCIVIVHQFRFRPIAALGLDSSSVPESFDMLAAQEEFARDCLNVKEARDYVSEVWKRNDGEVFLSPGRVH